MSAAEAVLLTLVAVDIGFLIGVVYATWRNDTPLVVHVPDAKPSPIDGLPTPGETPDFVPDYFFDQDAGQ